MKIIFIKLIIIILFLGASVASFCASISNESRAEVGRYNRPINCLEVKVIKEGETPSYLDETWDSYCSHIFLKRVAPHGMVSVFGGAHLFNEHTPEYQLIREFSRKWTEQKKADTWPVASGGGPGLMEAALRGAEEAREGKGRGISLRTSINSLGHLEPESSYALAGYKFMYRNLSKRESDLIDYAQAIIIGPGGFGTMWEMFEALEKVHSGKKHRIPIIILARQYQGSHLASPVFNLIQNGLLEKNNCNLFNITYSADKAVALILMSQDKREHDESSACSFFQV